MPTIVKHLNVSLIKQLAALLGFSGIFGPYLRNQITLTFQIYFDKKVMEASEEHYLLALVSAMNLSHLVQTNSTAADLSDILEQVAR